MIKYITGHNVNISNLSPLKYDLIFGPTYIGFDKIRNENIRNSGEIGAIMQVVHKNEELVKYSKEKSKLIKKL